MNGLVDDWREQVERYVRPLYRELDGADTFVRVERLERRLERIVEGEGCDRERLALLALFHGVVDRLGSLATGGRWQLLLNRVGVPAPEIARLRQALGRLDAEPGGNEEAMLHDARLLDRTGVQAAVDQLLFAGRKRVSSERAVAMLDPGPPPERFRTGRGRELARERYSAAERWIADLRAALAAEALSRDG